MLEKKVTLLTTIPLGFTHHTQQRTSHFFLHNFTFHGDLFTICSLHVSSIVQVSAMEKEGIIFFLRDVLIASLHVTVGAGKENYFRQVDLC